MVRCRFFLFFFFFFFSRGMVDLGGVLKMFFICEC